ncbi:hypothetical protein ACQP1P_28745 [Dactylosporangium sp. CA-052675]|uniref:hypothetical protein n=1 Tax=Dactylosporangium sp. CA-052675 TaxID=3239927 RepID=UPI003D8C028C
MTGRDHFGESASSMPEENAAVLAALPGSLAQFLARLALLSPAGQGIALAGVGPGSRLLLEALKVLEHNRPALTELGLQIVERLAEHEAAEDVPLASIIQFRPRARPAERIVTVAYDDDTRALVASVATQQQHIARYNLLRDAAPAARIEVARARGRLRLWQLPGVGSATVVFQPTMEPLPMLGEPELAVPNPDGLPPSALLRDVLWLVDDTDAGAGEHTGPREGQDHD